MAITVINSVLMEVQRRLGTKADQKDLFTWAELDIYINRWKSTKALTRVATRIGDFWYCSRRDEHYWYLTYDTVGVGTGVSNNYNEDTVNGVIELTSGLDADTPTKSITAYPIDLDMLMAELFEAIAQSKEKLAMMVSIQPGAEINPLTLANSLRQAARRLRDKRWLR